MTKIDWNQYYREFALAHGGNPVLVGNSQEQVGKKIGYLLFPDGWMYSASDSKGPEYPPPTKEERHKDRIKKYWSIRKRVLELEYRTLKDEIQDLVRTQQLKNVPLQVAEVVITEDEDGKRSRRQQVGAIDFMQMLQKLEILKTEVSVCENMLVNITIPIPQESDFSPAGILTKLQEIDSEQRTTESVR